MKNSRLDPSWRSAFVFLLCAAALAAMVDWRPWERQAVAQIPDSGLQRKHIVDESRRTNELLTEIRDLLQEMVKQGRVVGQEKRVPGAPKE